MSASLVCAAAQGLRVIIHHNPEAEHEQRERVPAARRELAEPWCQERDEVLRSREMLAAKQDKMRKEYDPLSLE